MGSSSARNHHSAFDSHLLVFHPDTAAVVFRDGITADQLGVTVPELNEQIRPHIDALRWRWEHAGAPGGSKVA
jgi:hypothetical protein